MAAGLDNRGILVKFTNAKMLDWLDSNFGGGSDSEAMWENLMNRAEGFTWIGVNTENGLVNGRALPTQIISQLFTGEYQTSDGTSYFGTEGSATRMSGLYDTGSPPPGTSTWLGTSGVGYGPVEVNLNQLGSIFLSNLNTSYCIKATLAYLPNSTGESDTNMYGFLNWQDRFKMTYDFDVYAFINQPTPAGLMNIYNTAAGVEAYGYEAADELLVRTAEDDDGENWKGVSGGSSFEEYTYWPPYDKSTDDLSTQNAAWARSQMNMPYDRNTDYHATTYSIEAVAMDFMDALTEIPENLDDLFSGSKMNHSITDPNYFIHSNTLWSEHTSVKNTRFRVDEPYFSADGATYISPLIDDSTNSRLVKLIKCRFTAKHSKQGFLSYDNGEVYNGYYQKTRYEGNIPSKDLWEPYYSRYGTHRWEKDCFTAAVEMMCDDIQAELEVTEYPKKLLNKVQKRGKLRDEQISAFGYTAVDEEAYKLYLAQGGSAQPISWINAAGETVIGYTGETPPADAVALSEDASTGPSETGTYWGAESDMTWEEYVASQEFEGSK